MDKRRQVWGRWTQEGVFLSNTGARAYADQINGAYTDQAWVRGCEVWVRHVEGV